MYLGIVFYLILFTIEVNSSLLIKFNKANIPQEIVENVHFEVIYSDGGHIPEQLVKFSFGEYQLPHNISIVKRINAVYGYHKYLQTAHEIKSIVDVWQREYHKNEVSAITSIVVGFSDFIRPQRINILNEEILFKNPNGAIMIDYMSKGFLDASINSWRVCATVSLVEIKSYCTNEKFLLDNSMNNDN